MIGVVDVECQAANPNMPLYPMRAFVGSPSSIRVRNVPKRIGKWAIESVQFVAAYPDGSIKTAQCVLTGCVWVGTIEGTQTSGTSKNGYTIFASGTDENGNAVTGYVLGKGDITILEADGTLNPDAPSYYVHFYPPNSEKPTKYNIGDSEFLNGVYSIYDGEEWRSCKPDTIPAYIADSNGNVISADRSCVDAIPIAETVWHIEADITTPFVSHYEGDATYNGGEWNYTDSFGSTIHIGCTYNRFREINGWRVYGSMTFANPNTHQAIQTLVDFSVDGDKFTDSIVHDNIVLTRTVKTDTKLVTEIQLDSAISSKADLSALELKQDKLSEDQTYVIDREVNDLYTRILTPTGSFSFLSPSTLDKSVLIQQGILSQDGNTWLYSPQRVILGSNVGTINSNTFKDAVLLEHFEASNAVVIQSNVFNGCTRLNTVTIPNVTTLGSYVFRYCSALKKLTLPKSLLTVGRFAFADNSLDYVFFEGKTLEQVKAMANYDRWGLAEDKIYTNAFENQLPTKTSELSNDSGFITSADIITKRDLSDISYPSQIEGEDYKVAKWTLVIAGQDEAIDGIWNFDNFTNSSGYKNWSAQVPKPTLDTANIGTYDGRTFYVDMAITRQNYEYYTDPLVSGSFTLSEIVDGQPTNITLTFAYREGTNRHEFTATITPTLRQTTFAMQDYVDAGLEKKADLSAVGNATITLTQGGVTKGTFTTNQLSNQTIDLDAGGGGSSGYTVTVIPHEMDGGDDSGGVTVGGFSVTVARDAKLEANGHGCSDPLVFRGIEYIDVPAQSTSRLVYFNGTEKNNQFVQLTGDTTVDLYQLVCIAGGTLVPLANGTTKAIEEITYDDDLLVWDFDEGKLSYAKPAWIKKADYVFYSWETKLASGKSIKTCGQHGHRFFDLGTNTWVYADEISGKTVYTLDGADEVISSERVDGKVDFFNVITKGHINHFGNGILLGCSLENYLYPVENMRFVKDNRASRPYSEFAGDVPEWWYNECRYAESTASRDYLVKYCKDRLPIMLPKS